MPQAIDSNSTQAYYGEEASLGVQSPGPFYPLEPNSYSSWGVDTKNVVRAPINIARQQAKGTTTELDVAAGFQSDYTQSNLLRLMQGMFFADIIDKPTTLSMNAAQVAISSVDGTSYTTASPIAFLIHHILQAKNFANAANNGLMLVSGVATDVITAAAMLGGATVVEATPPAAATLRAVGFQLSAAATLNGLGGSVVSISDTGRDFTTLGMNPGEWIYVGDSGNATAALDFNFYGNVTDLPVRGYARISAIALHTLTFDFITFGTTGDASGAVKAGGGAAVNIYFGSFLKNQATLATIKRRSYTMPRYLGKGAANADQLEVMLGCVPDKFTLNVAQASKLTADLTFVGINSQYSNAAMLAGTIKPFFNEKAFNTSQDLFASLLTIVGSETGSLFAYATDNKITIDNGANAAKALGSPSGFDVSVGDFKVSGTASLYFDDIAALQAVQNNSDVGLVDIFAKSNAGMVFDVPLLTLGGGQLKIEKDKKIMCDITSSAAANAYGFTAAMTNFFYIPNPAMSRYTGL